ncbi:UNVERIFIED_CONTAM: hypothetical protein Slati_0478400, partial [Sesamum latifolium]
TTVLFSSLFLSVSLLSNILVLFLVRNFLLSRVSYYGLYLFRRICSLRGREPPRRGSLRSYLENAGSQSVGPSGGRRKSLRQMAVAFRRLIDEE